MTQPHPGLDEATPPPTMTDAAEAADWSLYDFALILLSVAVIGAAGWLSFETLEHLGSRVGWGDDRSWLLPLCIDVQAAVGTLGWLHPTIAADTRATARNMTITAVALSTAGNAVEHLITALTHKTPWWEVLLTVLVGALPVLAMALTIHLVSKLLANRSRAKADVARAERAAAEEDKRKPKGKRARTQDPATRAAPEVPAPARPPVTPDRTPEVPAAVPDVPVPPADESGTDPFRIVSPAVAAEGLKIGERLNLLIDHLTGHGVSILDLSGKLLADNLQQVYRIACSEQRGRQVLSPRKKAAELAAADQPREEATSSS